MSGIEQVEQVEQVVVKKPRKPRAKKTVVDKPPTQGVGVTGFVADVYAADEKKINWPHLMAQPKFQMYCVELSRRPHGEVELWLGGFIQDRLAEGEKIFFQSYCDWHDKKGYWKQEDYYGNLI